MQFNLIIIAVTLSLGTGILAGYYKQREMTQRLDATRIESVVASSEYLKRAVRRELQRDPELLGRIPTDRPGKVVPERIIAEMEFGGYRYMDQFDSKTGTLDLCLMPEAGGRLEIHPRSLKTRCDPPRN